MTCNCSGKESACQCRRHGCDPGLGRSPGGRNGNPLQYSWRILGELENPMDRRSQQATVQRVATKQQQHCISLR